MCVSRWLVDGFVGCCMVVGCLDGSWLRCVFQWLVVGCASNARLKVLVVGWLRCWLIDQLMVCVLVD